ncbi:Phytochrome-like protein cph1 [Caulifigura coniformis]|uniref:histidine kinase n=1 Tax=Caulifigura coniformis TaxID=2527983 RepID=A0A517SBA0_9PLAN|nr:ATP-binding protein [Caulifigura coniformis]QDT53384.1 Phytochrome-like protein cph1 [Caulifigura coniformis]
MAKTRDYESDPRCLSSLSVAAGAIDPELLLSSPNAAAVELLHLPNSGGEPIPFLDHVHPFDRASIEPDLRAAFGEPRSTTLSCRVGTERIWCLIDLHLGAPCADGLRFVVMIPKRFSAPAQNHAGASHAAQLASRDDQAEEWRRFAYTVAHDLKVPLVTMESNLLLMEQDLRAGRGGSLTDDLKEVGEAVQKMKRLVVELLELARIGRLDLVAATHSRVMDDIDVDSLVDQVVREIRTGNPAWQGTIERIDSLPPVRARRTQITEVFQNLIDNAVKYSAGAESPRVEIGCRRQPDGVVYYVRDNGFGIPRHDRTRVFDLFVQLRPDAAGVGIGLPIVRSIISSHGGRVWVEDGIDGLGASLCLVLNSLAPQP